MSERKYTKSQLKEYEREIVDTYDYIRADERFLTRVARIQRELIDLNTENTSVKFKINLRKISILRE